MQMAPLICMFVTQQFNAVGTRADEGSHLLCLLSSEGQQIVSRVHLQCAALTETDTPRPHRVHHLAATLSQVPQAHLHVPALTAPINTDSWVYICRFFWFPQNYSWKCKTTIRTNADRINVPSSPDECTGRLQRADPDDRIPWMAFQDLLSSPGVQVPHVDLTFPWATRPSGWFQQTGNCESCNFCRATFIWRLVVKDVEVWTFLKCWYKWLTQRTGAGSPHRCS